MEMKDTLSLDEALQYLGISRPTLFRWLQDGRLSGTRLGRKWRFERSHLDTLSQPDRSSLHRELQLAIHHYKNLRRNPE